jgi:hypothetical protein
LLVRWTSRRGADRRRARTSGRTDKSVAGGIGEHLGRGRGAVGGAGGSVHAKSWSSRERGSRLLPSARRVRDDMSGHPLSPCDRPCRKPDARRLENNGSGRARRRAEEVVKAGLAEYGWCEFERRAATAAQCTVGSTIGEMRHRAGCGRRLAGSLRASMLVQL